MRADNYGAGCRGAPEIASSGPQVGQTLTGGHCRPHFGKPWLSAPQSEEGNRLFWGSPQTTLKFGESLEGLKRIQRNCYTDGLLQQKNTYKNLHTRESPSGQVVRTLHIHCPGSDFDSWWRNYDLASHVVQPKGKIE